MVVRETHDVNCGDCRGLAAATRLCPSSDMMVLRSWESLIGWMADEVRPMTGSDDVRKQQGHGKGQRRRPFCTVKVRGTIRNVL